MDTPTNLTKQVQSDYLAYSLAVIVGRAIPSLYDGMKPVHRRILTAMKWLNLRPDSKYMKSARVEGEVMGKLHPHGSAYGAIVTLAAPWSNNVPFIDGQGNYGSSVDGAAASRYTEAKLTPFAWDALLSDSETWDLTENYDGSLKEPTVLNVKVPAVLLNGQDGIAVGFATKIPQHDLRDVCNAITKGTALTPSFSTGCDIINDEGLDSYQRTGIGTLRLRARCETAESEKQGRKQAKATLTFTNLPPNTNPEKIGQQIKDGLDKGNLVGITEVRDESDLTGDRITVVLKSGTDLNLATRQLYHYSDLESAYSARLLVVDGVKPVELSPSELLARWQTWRLDRLGICFRHERDERESRLELVRGYLKAIDKIDAVIKIIRSSSSAKDAVIELVSNRALKFTSAQAKAILEMKLRSLTNLDSDELKTEEESLKERLSQLEALISDPKVRKAHMIKEIKAIGVRYGEKRRSEMIDPPERLAVGRTVGTKAPSAPKPRFMLVDAKKGTVSQAKGPRGALVLESKDKVILMTHDGTLRKVPANYKGPISTEYSPVVLAKKEADVIERKYLLVFILDDTLKAMVVSGADLAKANSKGKSYLPPTATLVQFGEGKYTVPWANSRKKAVTLDLTVKAGKPGGKGVKVANLSDLNLSSNG